MTKQQRYVGLRDVPDDYGMAGGKMGVPDGASSLIPQGIDSGAPSVGLRI